MENGKSNGTKYNPIVVAVIGSILGSGGALSMVFNTSTGQSLVRPDPFTGTEATKLEATLEHLQTEIEIHLRQHPDTVNQFDRRITTLEVQYSNIILGQQRIIERIDKMNGD